MKLYLINNNLNIQLVRGITLPSPYDSQDRNQQGAVNLSSGRSRFENGWMDDLNFLNDGILDGLYDPLTKNNNNWKIGPTSNFLPLLELVVQDVFHSTTQTFIRHY